MGENLGSEVAGTDLYGVQMSLNVGVSVGLPWRWGANTLGARTASGGRWVDVAGKRRTQINGRSPVLKAGSTGSAAIINRDEEVVVSNNKAECGLIRHIRGVQH